MEWSTLFSGGETGYELQRKRRGSIEVNRLIGPGIEVEYGDVELEQKGILGYGKEIYEITPVTGTELVEGVTVKIRREVLPEEINQKLEKQAERDWATYLEEERETERSLTNVLTEHSFGRVVGGPDY